MEESYFPDHRTRLRVRSLSRKGGTLRAKLLGAVSEGRFEVACDAGRAGQFRVVTESLSVKVGQRFQTDGSVGLQAWDSVLVSCGRTDEGSLDIQILLFHPDWDEPRQLALIKSRSNNHGMDFPILSINFGDNCATGT